MEREGRGAWPNDGRGGTLNAKGTGPGKFYTLSQDPLKQVGLAKICRELKSQPIPRDENATFHAVLAIQALLIEDFSANLKGDGVFGPETFEAVKSAQRWLAITVDGVVGIETMKWLLWPHIHRIAKIHEIPWNVIYGFIQNEGNWDPGAVGYIDSNDVGLAQINLPSHPSVTESQAFCPSFSMFFIAGYIQNAMAELNNNVIDAVVSYNLGIGGTRQWIRAGRPTAWTPVGSDLERKPFEYAERILNAAQSSN